MKKAGAFQTATEALLKWLRIRRIRQPTSFPYRLLDENDEQRIKNQILDRLRQRLRAEDHNGL